MTTTIPSSRNGGGNDSSRPATFTACRILYATQSGRSKACARRTARILADSNAAIQLQNGKGTTFDQDPWLNDSLANFAANLKKKSSTTLLILFVSTTGDGEQTDTIQRTWRQLLQKSLPNDLLDGVHFCLFSLGDRAYGPQKFGAAGRKLTVRLRQLGAVLATPSIAYGDDGTANGGVFCDLDVWLQTTLLPLLLQQQQPTTTTTIAQPAGVESEAIVAVAAPYQITVLQTTPADASSDAAANEKEEEWLQTGGKYADSYRDFFQKQCPLTAYHYDNNLTTRRRQQQHQQGQEETPPLLGRVVQNERITANDWEQDTRHIRIEVCSNSGSIDGSAVEAGDDGLQQQQHQVCWSLDSLPYRAGDVASILPANSVEAVTAFLDVLPQSLQEIADCELSVQFMHDPDSATSSQQQQFAGVGYAHWPSRCTLRGWLTYCADICALPEREDLRALGAYCSLDHPLGREQQTKLVSLSETQAAALYADYVLREKRNWADVLYDFDSLRHEGSKLTVEVLFGLLPPIRTRDFSIASSPSREWLLAQQEKNQQTGSTTISTTDDDDSKQQRASHYFTIELCVAVVEGTTRLGRSYHGLCSHYLGKSKAAMARNENETKTTNGSLLRLWIRPGSFHGLPLEVAQQHVDGGKEAKLTEPVMVVGAGTGIAPLRGLILERVAVLSIRANTPESSNTVAADLSCDNILVFGCRKKEMDYYYEKEWKELQQTGRLVVHTAFSRDQWHKIYVQQVLEDIDTKTNLISRHIIERNGSVYIAGGPRMARAVKDKLVESLSKELNGNEKQAQQLLSKLQRVGRFSVEAWS